MPFHALFDGDRHVVDTSTVSYAPSASVYARCHTLSPVETQGALVMGVADAKTPFIPMEAEAVAAALPGARLFLGANATEAMLRAHGGNSRFVHIASHAYFRPGSPMFSALQLSDTHLNVHDLYHLRMPAELVTLSGCATGAGITTGGDERLGIARGLFCAGARALLVSLGTCTTRARQVSWRVCMGFTGLRSSSWASSGQVTEWHTSQPHSGST